MAADFSNVRALTRKSVRARKGGRSWPLFGLSLLPLIVGGVAHAGGTAAPVLPHGGVVTSGTATITGSGSNVTISQSSSKAIINWDSFSISQGGEVDFLNGAGATLNRVTGGTASEIDGLLHATGSVYVINSAGIVVGKTGVVSTGGRFVASTLDLSDANFLTGGNLTFQGSSQAAVVNLGKVGSLSGDVALIAQTVQNTGSITAPGGTVGLLSGSKVLIKDQADASGLFSVEVGATGAVTNAGAIQAAAAELRANGGNIYALAGQTGGLIAATGTARVGGRVLLVADNGETELGGTITAQNADGSGGSIETSGAKVIIGKVNVDPGKGGTWTLDPTALTIDSVAANSIQTTLQGGGNVSESGGTVEVEGVSIAWSSAANLSLMATSGALTLDSGASITATGAGNISLGATGAFVNNSTSTAVTTNTGRWLIYSATPGGDSFGGLASGATAVWNTAEGAAVTPTGDRYVFTYAPTLTFTSTNASKAYGATANVSSDYTVSGYQSGVAGAFLGDTASTAFSGAPSLTSNGTAANATVAGGPYKINISAGTLASAGGYGFSFASNGSLSLSKETLTVSLTGSVVKTYDGSISAQLSAANYVLSGVTTGDTVVLNDPIAGSYNNATAGSAKTVTVSGLAISGANAANYVLASTVVSAAIGLIDPKVLTTTLTGTVEKTYDGTTTATVTTANFTALSGVLTGDFVSLSTTGSTATYANANVGAGITVSVTGLSLTGAKAVDYTIANPASAAIGVIDARALTVNLIGVVDKTYDGSLVATLSAGNYQLVGVASGDQVSLNDPTTGTYDTKDAGTGKTVTVTGLAITGAQAGDYTLAGASVQGAVGEIDPKALTVSLIGAAEKTYDGTTSATLTAANYSALGGVIGNDVVTLNAVLSGTYSSKDVGSGLTVTVSGLTLGGANASDYAITGGSVSGAIGKIDPLAITASLSGVVEKTYDGTNAATLATGEYTLNGVIASDSVGLTGSGTYGTSQAGSNLSVSIGNLALTGGSAGDYTLSTATLSSATLGKIDPKALTVTLTGPVTKTYDGTTSATLTSGEFTLTGVVGNDQVSVSTTTSGAYASKDAGTGIMVSASGLTLGGNQAADYTFSGIASGAVGVIDPKLLAVTLTGTATKTYDGGTTATLASANYTISGFVGSDSGVINQTSGTYASKDAGTGIVVTASLGASNFTASGSTVSGDYALPTSATGAIGVIDPKVLTASLAGTVTKTYDGTTTATIAGGNITLSGLVGSDSFTVSQSSGTYASKDAGTGIGVTTTLTSGEFTAAGSTVAGDYVLPTSASGAVGVIDPKLLGVTLTGSVSKTYDGTTAATLTGGDYSISGFVGSDSGTITQTSGTYASKDAGTGISVSASLSPSNFSASGSTVAGDYTLPTSASGSVGVIDPKTLTASLTGTVTKTYDGGTTATLGNANYVLAGLVGSDSFTVTQTSGTYASKDAGTGISVTATLAPGEFTASGSTVASDYVLPGSATGLVGVIDAKALTLALTGTVSKTYDGTTTAMLANGNYQFSGLVGSDSFTVTQTSGTYASKDAGTGINVSANLTSGQFTASGSTVAGDYVLPTSAAGLVGVIDPEVLTAALTGTVTKTYDGGTAATLGNANYVLTGLIGSDSFTVTQTSGTYASKDAGTGIGVTATLSASNFSASGATVAGDYVLPTSASGAVGVIDAKTLTAALTGTVTKTYDGTTTATLVNGDYALTGLVGSDSFVVTQTSGTYASKDAGTGIGVSTTLSAGQFTATGSTLAGDYILPTAASGSVGVIDPKLLTVNLTGTVSKTYDGTTTATLTGANYSIAGFVGSETGAITQTSGTYASKDAGSGITVTASLASGELSAGAATLASDYVLPATASGGVGVIDPKTLTASLTGTVAKTYDGTTNATLVNGDYALTGLVGSDSFTVTQTSGTYASKDAGTGIGVSTTLSAGQFTAVGSTVAGDYVLPGSASGSVGVIDPATLTASLTGTVTKTYDGTTSATLGNANYVLTGLFGSDSFTVTQTSGIYASKDAGTGITITASLTSGQFTASGATVAGDYVLPTTASGAIGVIDPKTLTATLTGTVTKTYDGTTSATLVNGDFALSGLVGSDSFTVSQTSGTYASKDAGSGIAVSTTLTSGQFAAVGSTVTGDYVLPTSAAGNVGVIDPAVLTAALTGTVTKTYDGTIIATLGNANYVLTGLVGSDSFTVTQTSGAYASKDAGTGINVTASLTSGQFTASGSTVAGDYVLPTAAAGAIGVIDPKLLGVSLTGTVQKTYDGTTTATLTSGNYSITGFVGGDSGTINQTSGTYASKDAGSGIQVAVDFTSSNFSAANGTVAGDYFLPSSISAAVGLIDPKTLTASLTGTIEKTYDGTIVATLGNANYVLTGLVGSDSFTVTQTSGAYASKDAGTGINVTASLTSGQFTASGSTVAGDYVLPTAAAGAIGVIDPKLLGVSLTGTVQKTYDGTTTATLTSGNYSITGFVGGDSGTINQTSGTYASKDAGSGIQVAVDFTSSNFSAANGTVAGDYFLPSSISAAVGLIDPKTLTASLTGTVTKTYDGTTNATLGSANYVLSGLVGSDSFTVTQTSGTYASKDAGTGINVTASLTSGQFTATGPTLASDYVLPTAAAGAIGVIDPAVLTATLQGAVTKTYDGTTTATLGNGNYQLTGLVGSDSFTVTQTSGTYAQADVGTGLKVTASLAPGNFTATGSTVAGDYVLPTSAWGNVGQIDALAITAQLSGVVEKTYDGTLTATLGSNYQLIGVLNADASSVALTATGAYQTKDAGSGINVSFANLALSGSKANDYSLSNSTMSGNVGQIDPMVITAAISGTIEKTYDGTVTATLGSNYTLPGVIQGDTVTLTSASGAYASPNAATSVGVTFSGLALGGGQAGDYTLSSAAMSSATAGKIDPATLTAGLTGTATKTYDGSLTIALTSSNFTLSGVIGNDQVSLTDTTTGTLDTIHVGTGKTVTVDEGLTGGAAGNYVLASSTLSAPIGIVDPAVLTATLTGPVEKTYDGTTAATATNAAFTLVGVVGQDNVTVSSVGGTATYQSANAGTGISVTVTNMQLGGTNAGDYVLSSTNAVRAVGIIDPKALTVNLVGSTEKTYDGTTIATLTSANYQVLGVIGNDQVFLNEPTTGNYATPTPGQNKLVTVTGLTLSGTSSGNYSVSTGSGKIGKIDPRPATNPGSGSGSGSGGAVNPWVSNWLHLGGGS
jgi:filamentous hemagglutinin family protein